MIIKATTSTKGLKHKLQNKQTKSEIQKKILEGTTPEELGEEKT